MRKDQIFVLMLVILLPMSGCFDGAIGEAEGNEEDQTSTTVVNNYYNNSVNQEPIIYGGFGSCSHECWYDGDVYHSYVRVTDLFSVDPDGNITDFGMDWNNDFQIDWTFPWDWNYSHQEIIHDFDYSVVQINQPVNPNDPDDHCYTDYINLISKDDRGLKTISPMKWRFDWDEDEERCEVGPHSDD